ncbi:tyrosine--tRNA ligase, partial [Candidatus Falkowbacteria bacterium]|nr:tyrosine--tRNA ligase [Candidatus Falkowbacteria bacterium]
METKKLEEFLTRGVENIYPKKDFLASKLKKGEKLRIYAGVDPTGESLHLGHATVFRKLAKLHEMGHAIILLIGSFTAKIGDPTGKLSARIQLTDADIKKNMKGYVDQLSGILNFNDKKNPIEIAYNDSWLAPMSFADVVSLSSHFTVHQMLERDMFQERIKGGKPIFIHEFLYPLMQGYDSVALDVDMEIGGNDQTFNMLAGRTLLKSMREKEKIVMTLELLVDSQGKKMSKTDNNFVALTDSGKDMYGKIMSWPDEMMQKAFRILTDVSADEIAQMSKSIKKGANPRDIKMKLAYEVVRLYKR